MPKNYRTIVADPPWKVLTPRSWDAIGTGKPVPYSTLSVDEIKALPVAEFGAEHLYLWTVNKYVEDAYDVARAWGFQPVQLLTWCKAPGRMMGPLFATTTEFILFARNGPQGGRGCKHGTSWWQWPRRQHSAKPEAFLDIVEQVSPGPYLEMFARRARFGWDYYGDQSLGTAEMPDAA